MDNSPSAKPVQPAPMSPSPEQAQLDFEFSSPEKMQLEFKPSPLDSEPLDVPKDPLDLSSFGAVLPKTVDFIDFQITQDLEITCDSTRSCLKTSFLKTLASKGNPDRDTSKFIAKAIGNGSDTCLWPNTSFSLEGLNTPNGLSIHLFTNMAAKKVLSHEVHAMIIQVSEPFDSHSSISEFLDFFFSKVSLTKLKCLMLYGIQPPEKFSQWIKALNLEKFHVAKFGPDIGQARWRALRPCNTSKELYIVHPDNNMMYSPPKELEKLGVYCPESGESVTNGTKTHSDKLFIILDECHAPKEM
jgi:hypothetical protein